MNDIGPYILVQESSRAPLVSQNLKRTTHTVQILIDGWLRWKMLTIRSNQVPEANNNRGNRLSPCSYYEKGNCFGRFMFTIKFAKKSDK